MMFNNIMDLLQLVFSFINAPLFATFLLGMFWKRTTATARSGACWRGTGAAAVHYLRHGRRGLRRTVGWHAYPSDMAQNFWGAIFAWTTCFVLTIASVCHEAARRKRPGRPRLLDDAASGHVRISPGTSGPRVLAASSLR